VAEATAEQLEQRGEQLKERVYITFTALAVVLALRADVDHETVGGAAGTLTVAVIGTLLAVLLADVIAHITVHQALPTRAELRHMVAVVLGAAETLVLPLIVFGLSALGLFGLDVALTTTTAILVVTLVAVGYLAVRRLKLPLLQRLLVLLAESVLGLVVVGLELLAH
jgi:ABC-type amino acid transport system permease subunit